MERKSEQFRYLSGRVDAKLVIGAFQLHFDQANVTGEPAPSTMARLFALIEKYLPRDLAKFDMAD